jgi:pyridoxal phosphate enzyme (YggS family)
MTSLPTALPADPAAPAPDRICISTNLAAVHERIRRACAAAGREATAVHLLAVSKTFGAEAVVAAAAAGQQAFGENYLQEAVAKIQAVQTLPQSFAGLEWHCIGPVQSNKTKLVAAHFDWLHTLDRLKIAERLSAQRAADQAPLNVCLQVNMDGEDSKSGVAPQALLDLAQAVAVLPRLRLRGLMTIPAPRTDFQSQLAVHQAARALFEQVKTQLPVPHDFDTLSMGMSADLEAAIHAGSTLVRVGSAIFGQR